MSVFESIKALSKSHEIYLLSRVEPSELSYVEDIRPFCKEVNLYLFKTPASRAFIPIICSYIMLGLKANRLMKKNDFDMVQVEFIETGIAVRRPRIPSVIVAHDVISKPAKRRLDASRGLIEKVFNLLKFKSIQWCERFISRKFDRVFVMSEVDKQLLLSLDKTINAEVLPNLLNLNFGVDDRIEREPKALLFAGAMHRDVNVDAVLYFYEKILPRIREKTPEVKFYIVGNNPPDILRKLAEKDENLIITGFVEDMGYYFSRAAVFVSPLLVGGGIIAKNLQAMAYGLPVVTSSIGNEGIGGASGSDLFVADAPSDFAEKVLLLLNDADLRKKIGLNGKILARKNFSDIVLIERRIKVYEELCGR
ncbi:MAG: glycosyltransferase family 4 protein [Deltaproteobacteria bacterium]|nr:glycosyltransferase family 4 protein [Deltaproteobacteria bacterium]